MPAKPSFAEFVALKNPDSISKHPLVIWDNYLHGLTFVRPRGRLFRGLMHQDIVGHPALPFERVEWFQSAQADHLGWPNEGLGRLLINLDLDYFFIGMRDRGPRIAFSKEYIEWLVGRLLDQGGANAIWTIAWSPECCGGWEESRKVARIVDRVLGTRFPFKALPPVRSD